MRYYDMLRDCIVEKYVRASDCRGLEKTLGCVCEFKDESPKGVELDIDDCRIDGSTSSSCTITYQGESKHSLNFKMRTVVFKHLVGLNR